MEQFVRDVLEKVVWVVLGQKFQIKYQFKRSHGYEPNFTSPKTLSEKIQWIKVYGQPERFSKYIDKYTVREFIKEKVGEDLLIPLIGVYQRTKEIDLKLLPNSFIIKTTHGSGWNIIVKDKTALDWDLVKKKIDTWLKSRYDRITGEANYKPIKGRILVEEYIEDPSGDLKDYKFFCFNGEPRYIQVDGTRFTAHKRDIYDLSWSKLPMKLFYENLSQPVAKPEKLDHMIEICRKLSQDFVFVRVDLYFTRGRIYFGELTFTPESGMVPFTPVQYDYIFGELLDLTKYC